MSEKDSLTNLQTAETGSRRSSRDDVDGAVDGAEFNVSVEELKYLMKQRGEDGIKALDEKFGGVRGLLRSLRTSSIEGILGLEEDVRQRVEAFGSNYIPPKPPKTFLRLIWESLEDTILRILIVASVFSLILGMVFEGVAKGWVEGFAIFIAVMIVSLVTAVNDYEKEKQFRSLQGKIESEHKIAVIRNGKQDLIVSKDLVVGDLCQLKYGDVVPADGIILQNNDLKIDESSLTGESDMVKKGERDLSLFSATHVTEGSCKMIVTAVGPNSQAGIIFSLLGAVDQKANGNGKKENEKEKPPVAGDGKFEDVDLKDGTGAGNDEDYDEAEDKKDSAKSVLQAKLTKLAVTIGWIGVGAAAITTLVLILRFLIETYAIKKESWSNKHLLEFLNAFITGLTIMVVAIPEGLPLAVTIALAYSVKRMLDDKNLVRHLDACETMGNATAICSDKTGTLTTNRMTVVESFILGEHRKTIPSSAELPKDFLELLCRGIALNTNSQSRIQPPPPNQENALPMQLGNKTECALLGFVLEVGDTYQVYRDETPEEKYKKVFTFNSSRKSMTTVVPLVGGGFRIYTKGASEMVLSKCTFITGAGGKVTPFGERDQQDVVKNVIDPMASNGLRTIGIAYKDIGTSEAEPDWDDEAIVVSNLTCVAIFGIEDPVRPEVPPAIRKCQSAGVTVRMVTGDNISTARAIATKCGILDANSDFLVLDGKEFNKRIRDKKGNVRQNLLDEVWPKLRVLARSSPEDKYTLVKGIIDSKISKAREIVAVTGDGTNDGPALKKADVGFAMGIQGTDVAKEASDIILTDDNFNSIVQAVKWGRNVYDSISKFIQFQLTVNLVAIITSIIGAIVVKKSPLTAIQLLWVNLIMDSLASLALATEQPTDSLLQRKPYGRTKPLLSLSMMRHILGHGFFQLIIMFILTFHGHVLFDVPYGFNRPYGAEPTQHLTIVFNTFVLLQVFNEINSRKVHGERNVFSGIFSNRLFLAILIGTVVVQVLLVEFTGRFFSVKGLTLEQWMWCLFLGFTELIWGQVVLSIPKSVFSKRLRFFRKGIPTKEVITPESSESSGRVLWLRGLTRLQHQIRVVNAFKTGMDHRQRTMNIISPAVFNSLVGPVGTGFASSDEPTTPSATLVDTVDGNDETKPIIAGAGN
ncbi:plasma membrane calcium-transporting ATPase 1-like [Rhopilema esculentum]|uniref:plasma membrane calcium-transporting ATPase 1-like n=1 Tax=Rhopilema esculentum TaxID=499914 RepID=UPI0031E413A5